MVDTSWAGSVLLRDIVDVKRLKQEDGANLVTLGSTELVHALLANDLVVGHYERAGEIRIGDTALDSPSDREATRRERMMREG